MSKKVSHLCIFHTDLKLYELLPAFIISTKTCTKECSSQSLYYVSLFTFVLCTEHHYHNIIYISHYSLYSMQVAYICPDLYIVIDS